ncbi:MAG: hypothetical protein KIS92_09725 [Planctomycetota bacterium]|nr:hypothetical protein [Planctomycetota bacterium]
MHRWILAALLALLCARLAHADTVYMKNGLYIDGKIHVENNEYIILLVYNDSGRVKILRSMIERIEYDFTSKAATIQDDDVKGQHDLGVWAMTKGMYAEAVAQFEKVKGKEGAPDSTLKDLAGAYEHRQQLDKAYENYKEYLLGHADDADVKAKVDDLGKKLGITNGPENTPKPAVRDGHEVEFRWSAEKWANANDCDVNITQDKDTGNKMLVIQAKAGKQDKIAFGGTGKPLDLSGTKEILFKIYHTAPENARLAIALINEKNEFFESKQVGIPPKAWSTQSIKIDGKDFKCAKDGWAAYGHEVDGRDHIKKIIFMIYSQRDFVMYVDSIFFR